MLIEERFGDKVFENCKICPRSCGVNRIAGEKGYCGQGAKLTAARAYLHAWEEPCISGEHGSGTVFFSGCNMRCVFCQNAEIASGDVKKEISTERLSEIFLELQEKKASNINLVTPTHFVPLIIPAIEGARQQGLRIPIVYNTSAYENVETLKALEGLVDIYLPDCKYYSDELAVRYSKAPGYFKVSMDAIGEMIRQVGEPIFVESVHKRPSFGRENSLGIIIGDYARPESDGERTIYHNCREDDYTDRILTADMYNDLMSEAEDDYAGPLMKKGVIVRHLMLPGQLEDSKKVVEEVVRTFGDKVYLSIMNQFTPHGDLSGFPELLAPVDPDDYEALIDYAIDLGLENGFFQGEGTDSESFIPKFDFEGI
ncbi:radical SAM protein [Butyrivibrio sp. VCD2006]|uniref:radical SAM protein n=1 Tax=Butyrivibrio sp. VCD2006 TaxID=1280664 RepID=UPI00040F0BC3|nr:radical SAM protein [Butyrivibrio sp. VCD2006]